MCRDAVGCTEGQLSSAIKGTGSMYRYTKNDPVSSDSDVDSLAEELDQIGRLHLNISLPNMPNLNLSSYLNRDNLSLPTFDLPTLPNLPKLQDLSNEISRYISTYKKDPEKQEFASSIRTAVTSRLQMNEFLSDLKKGLSLSAAIERLQPLTNIIHETIVLPAEDGASDIDDDDREMERDTEPGGVDAVVTKNRPVLHDLVIPENEEGHRHTRGRHRTKSARHVSSDTDSSAYASDLDVEELTSEEARALTHLDTLDEFRDEKVLRQRIQAITDHKDLSQKLKNKLVTQLMLGNYYKIVNEKLKSEDRALLQGLKQQELVVPNEDNPSDTNEADAMDEDDFVQLTTEDTKPSYHDAPVNSILGCQHYQRNCKVECPTCQKWYVCRFCHDEESNHKLIRSEVKHVLCMHCGIPQVPDENSCVECGQELARYFCSKCVLYDNDPTKDIYHCDKCGICRLGLGLDKDYFHCDECNICLSIDLKERHKCLSNNTHCNCPVCNEYLFTSVNKVVFMKCGHLIHQSCYDELTKHSYKCPVCKKTVVNMDTQFRILDQEISQLPLPAPYSNWRCIINCNDCKGKSNVPYHILGLKCKYCKSYNTNKVKLIKPEEEQEEEEQEEATSVPMLLSHTNLESNFRFESGTEGGPDITSEGDDEEDEEDDTQDIVNLRRLVDWSPPPVPVQRNISSITSILQGFVNSASRE